MPNESFHATTIVSVRRNGRVVLGGDGQVTLGNTVVKANARKVRRLADGKVLAVPATFFLARTFLPGRWALISAALIATSLLDVNFSQQARPHAALAGLAAVTLSAALQLRSSRRSRSRNSSAAVGANSCSLTSTPRTQ